MNGPTLLAKHLKAAKLSQNGFGRKLGVAGAMVCRWLSGSRKPGPHYIFAIEAATTGVEGASAVPATAWDPDPPRKRKSQPSEQSKHEPSVAHE